jgi:hypothetical protein
LSISKPQLLQSIFRTVIKCFLNFVYKPLDDISN